MNNSLKIQWENTECYNGKSNIMGYKYNGK